MFVLAMISDTIRVPPTLLNQPTLTSITAEIEKRYPNRIIVDVGLVVTLYNEVLSIGDGILACGDGGAHHECVFRLVVFRPFVEEVLVGTVEESNEEGIRVSVGGFFDDVFIPAYWMLNPSKYDEATGLWVWTPTYDDEEEEEDAVKDEGGGDGTEKDADNAAENDGDDTEKEAGNQFDIDIGSEIRFKVKAVNFTRITTTMKGVQATTTTTTHMSKLDMDRALSGNAKSAAAATNGSGGGGDTESELLEGGVRRRSSSADLSDTPHRPAPMQIVGSICEDGLGLTSWWNGEAEEEEEEGGETEAGEEGEGFEGEGEEEEEEILT